MSKGKSLLEPAIEQTSCIKLGLSNGDTVFFIGQARQCPAEMPIKWRLRTPRQTLSQKGLKHAAHVKLQLEESTADDSRMSVDSCEFDTAEEDNVIDSRG